METEEEKERKNETKKELQLSPYDKRSALIVGEMIEWIGSSLLPTTVSWNAQKKAEMTALVLAIYADRLLFVVVFIVTVVVVEKS